MAEANFFPDSVSAKFTLNAQNVRLDSEEGLPPFIGRVVETFSGLDILPLEIPGTVKYDKKSPPAGSAIARFSIQESDKRLLIIFLPKGADIPNALFLSEQEHGPMPPIKLAEGEWTFDFN
ncbi:hypothetical protein CTheo_8083 [Ceratobasidium theobromae]|uniref:Uncharacterized protein n=1 Tax=Ceratobasidium theobromae TaxID=1582974 RepID=A0A5N5QA26_9AGAM|nr:hypothetical protein CTheo_8083 [Ceratobasidium theobromae]